MFNICVWTPKILEAEYQIKLIMLKLDETKIFTPSTMSELCNRQTDRIM